MNFTEHQKNAARCEIGRAVLRLPLTLHGAYAKAVLLSPQLVMTESDPLYFLPAAEYDINGAASRLALYWSTRHTCYGERAFLPMLNSTGSPGAVLTHPDFVALRESCMQRLPNDIQGQAVYIINTATITSSLISSGIRALFYQLHLAMEIRRVVFLVVASDEDASTTSLSDLETFFNLLSEFACKALPLQVTRLHILSSPSTTTSAHCARVKCIVEVCFANQRQTVVVVNGMSSSSQVHATKLFEPFGLARHDAAEHGNNLTTFAPTFLPRDSAIFNVQEEQIASRTLALKRCSPHPDQEEQGCNKKKFKASSSTVKPSLTASANDGTHSAEEEEGDMKVLSSLPGKNAARAKCPRRQEEEELNHDEAKVIRLKERNALYSRRKYERKKIEIEVLKEEAHRHKIQNAILLHEQQRLEKLVAQALECIKMHEEHGTTINDASGLTTNVLNHDKKDHSHVSILATA